MEMCSCCEVQFIAITLALSVPNSTRRQTNHFNKIFYRGSSQSSLRLSSCWQEQLRLFTFCVFRTTVLFSQAASDEYPPTSQPCRWPVLITLRTLVKFQLVWLGLCDAVLFFSSCLFEHTLTAVCVLPEYRSDRKYDIHPDIL